MNRKRLNFLLLLLVSAAPAIAAPDQWVRVRSAHFTVITNAGEKQGRHVLDQFERMRWLYATLFPKFNVDPPDPITVIAAKNEATFRSFEPAEYLGKGKLDLAGYFMSRPNKNYILLRLDAQQENPFATVYHEYTHMMFRSSDEWLPLWFNEGIAEFFQNTEIQNKTVSLGKPSGDDILYLRQQRLIPLPVLLTIDASSPYYHEEEKGSVFYAEAWALTHYLEVTDKQKGTNRIGNYLALMQSHVDSITAAQQAFGDLKRLQLDLESYISASNYQQFVMNSGLAPIDESSFTATPMTQTQTDADRADVLVGVRREQEGRDLIAAILKADPNNAQAMETLGELELHSGNRAEARKWFSQAVKQDSQSYLADYYYATVVADDDEAAAEASLDAALDLNPRFAQGYDRLAQLYLHDPAKRDRALGLILRAVQLDPGDLNYRMNAANVLMTLGRFDDTESTLRTALKMARNPDETALVQSRIDIVDQMKKFHDQAAQAPSAPGRINSGLVTTDSSGREIVTSTVVVTQASAAPKHPDAANGPQHTMTGVIQSVKCFYPSILELQLKTPSKTLALYSNDYMKLDLTALGFTPRDSMDPCTDFQGKNARVAYAETTDKTVDGQVLAVELHK